ncbi:MAG TPA: FecR domain-containing protein [Methylomirabilota bacterium]|nr:FecR domain-containing protein [Methylomirabilota bacterium]
MLAVLALASPAPAQAPRAGVVTTLQGTASVARQAAPESAPLRARDDVFVHDRISTGDQSLARILLGGKAVVTVREHSRLTITESASTSTIDIASGRIALVVDKSRIQAGESVQIRTPNAVAAIRGTVVITEVEAGAAGARSSFTLLTGVVDVSLLDAAGQPTGRAVTLNPLQSVGVVGFTPPGQPHSISRGEADAIASDYKVGLKQPPPAVLGGINDAQVGEAVRHAGELTGDSRGKDDGKGGDTADSKSSKKDKLADQGIGGAGPVLGDNRDFGRRAHGPGGTNSGSGNGGSPIAGGGAGGGDVSGDDVRNAGGLAGSGNGGGGGNGSNGHGHGR